MKNISRTLVAISFLSLTFLSCNQASKNDIQDAKVNLQDAGSDLKEAVVNANDTAKANATAEWEKFKNESDSLFVSMENQVNRLEVKISKADKKEKMRLKNEQGKAKQKLADLKEKIKQRNTELENNADRFDSSATQANESFKREFTHDMNELGSSFKDIFKDNVK